MSDQTSSGSQSCPKVTIGPDPVITGIKRNPSTGQSPKPVWVSFGATVTPADDASFIAFQLVQPGIGKALLGKRSSKIVGDSVQWTFEIGGVVPSPGTSNESDVSFEATCTLPGSETPSVVASVKILILIPTYQVHTVDESSKRTENTGSQGTDSTTVLTRLHGNVTVQILDQFKAPLSAIYDEKGVVWELCTDPVPSTFPIPSGWTPLMNDSGVVKMENGKVQDVTELISDATTAPLLTDDQLDRWTKGKYSIPKIGDNVFQNPNYVGGTLKQSIRVWGWDLKTKYLRTQQPTHGPYSPTPYFLKDDEF